MRWLKNLEIDLPLYVASAVFLFIMWGMLHTIEVAGRVRVPKYNMIELYTDGAYSPIRKQGGIAFVAVKDGKEVFSYGKGYLETTSQRMELLAAIIALESVRESSVIKIVSDSQYLVCTMNDGWKRKKNLDLWERLEKAVNKHVSVRFEWVKGHSDNEFNIKCDSIAQRCTSIEIKE
jgi:ribonuclease HI